MNIDNRKRELDFEENNTNKKQRINQINNLFSFDTFCNNGIIDIHMLPMAINFISIKLPFELKTEDMIQYRCSMNNSLVYVRENRALEYLLINWFIHDTRCIHELENNRSELLFSFSISKLNNENIGKNAGHVTCDNFLIDLKNAYLNGSVHIEIIGEILNT